MTIRRSFRAVATCALLAGAACGVEEEAQAPPPEPLVIESARTQVLVGTDTMLVFAPTMFAYFVVAPDPGGPPGGLIQLVQDFQESLEAARDPLAELDVRIEAVAELPRVLGMTPAEDAAAGPRLEGTPYGYVFVDQRGNVRRVPARMSTNDMVCTAARTFGLTPSAQSNITCG